jgi:hypothetical protein
MNKLMLMTALVAAALVVSFSLATGEQAELVGKPGEVKITPLPGPFSEIDASGAPAAEKDPADLCHGEWHGAAAYYIGGWFTGDEYYAIYQDPVETGCSNTYPFGVVNIIWFVQAMTAVTFDVQPLVYDYTVPDVIGEPLCSGPVYSVTLPSAGGYIITMPLGDTCCVDGPYYAGIYVATELGQYVLEIVTDDGVEVPPRSDAAYNDYGDGWMDMVDQLSLTYNLKLWSDGYNSDQNLCGVLVIPPGVDLFETPNDSMTVESLFTSNPLPADFFGPGSDPFDGIIALEGSPLATLPPDTLGPTDVIIKRLEPAVLDEPTSITTVPIQLIALSLRSTDPITVTYDGGMNPEDWQVDICLSSVAPPPYFGSMTITRHCDSGGSFTAEIYEVLFKATFTRVNPPGGPGPFVLDPYRIDAVRIIPDGRWATFVPPPFSVYTVVDWVEVDTDCNGSPDYSIPPDTSNFYPGITLEPCPPDPICGGKVLTLLDGDRIDHRMLPPQRTSPVVGACCLADDRCVLVDEVCCGYLGGTYKGDYTNCFPDPCVSCCNHDGLRGDVDMSNAINVGDVAYLVAYLFGSPPGPAPTCFEEADVDNGGSINVGDVSHLVSFLFGSPPGPAPLPCP